jgi:type I restriction enzyme S subunit
MLSSDNTKVDKDHTDLKYYVGGEHFESGNVTVTTCLIEGSTIGPMFYYGFKAGQFLLVSETPHLKKAGVVDFDGICSEKTSCCKRRILKSYPRIPPVCATK